MILVTVDTEKEKKAVIEASRLIHDTRGLDTDHDMVNTISHLYLAPWLIEVRENEHDR